MTTWRFENDGLVITLASSQQSASIVWTGVSDTRDPTVFLGPLTERLTSSVKGLETTVDFRKLEYVNSATVAPMISLVKALDANEMPVLVLFADADWQRTHLMCMKAIARTLKHVRVEGRSAST
jgi:hypothetical protein